jgi:hypothetical protein
MPERRFHCSLRALVGIGFHPKWRDVVLNAQVPGLTRFRAAQDWLDRTTSVAHAANMPPANVKLLQVFLQWKEPPGF